MFDLFSEEMRRNPYPAYDQLRSVSPLLHVAPFDLWMILDYDGVRRAFADHAAGCHVSRGDSRRLPRIGGRSPPRETCSQGPS